MTTIHNWHRPTDKLPDNARHVLIMLDGQVRIGWYGVHDKQWRRNDQYCATPTYWTPLPELPA